MAKAATQGSFERRLRGEFRGVTVGHDENGDWTFKAPVLNGKDVTVVIRNDGSVISSSLTAGALNPANAVIKVGQVYLCELSQYLSYLPYSATAELLVSPRDTAEIFNREVGTFNDDIASIRNIDKSHGIHHAGQVLTGMQIFDRPDGAKNVSYEKAWAKEVRSALQQACETGEAVTTGLAIGTKQIVYGSEIGTDKVTVANNLYSNVADINVALKAQGAQEIITSGDGFAHLQRTSTDIQINCSFVYKVAFTDGDDDYWDRKDCDRASSRPIALQISPERPGLLERLLMKLSPH